MGRLRSGVMVIAAVVGVLAATAACGGGDDSEADDPAPQGSSGASAAASDESYELKVELSEWAVKPAAATVKAGEVTFEVTNKGAAPHELVVVKTDLAPDRLPVSNGAADEKQSAPLGRTSQMAAGKTEEKTITLAAGKYVLLCNLPAHYGQGMRTALTVN